ncbi:MAG: hypothetical protein ABJB05_05890 [Parafilimonas sp.]
MNQSHQKLILANLELVRRYIGKTVIKFSRADYMTGGEENIEHFGPLQLQFEDCSFLTIDEAGDAESITIETTPLFFGATTENRKNNWTEILLNDTEHWKAFVGLCLDDADFLVDYYNERVWLCGCRLHFNNKRSITYYNYGDDAKVSFDNDKLLTSFIEYYGLRWTHENGG